MNIRNIASIFVLSFILTLNTVPCAEEPSGLKSLIDEALKNNPQIQAAQYRFEAAKARVRLFRTIDDPKLEYEYDKIIPTMTGDTGAMKTIALTQEIPFPGKFSLRKRSDEKDANSLEQQYRQTEQKIIKDVKENFYRLFLARKKAALTNGNLDLMKQLMDTASKKYSVEKASQQDVLKAQVEYSKLSNQAVLLEQEEKIALSMLNSLLNRPQGSAVETPGSIAQAETDLSEDKMISLTKENLPELGSMREMIAKAEIGHRLAKKEYLPDLMFQYRQNTDNGFGDSEGWSAMMGVTLPLWFWEKQAPMVKEADAMLRSAQADYTAAENTAVYETKSAFARFEAAKKMVKIYETSVLPQAQSALELSKTAYEADKTGFLDLLDSLRSLREFQMEYFESLAEMEIAFADLERAAGINLSE